MFEQLSMAAFSRHFPPNQRKQRTSDVITCLASPLLPPRIVCLFVLGRRLYRNAGRWVSFHFRDIPNIERVRSWAIAAVAVSVFGPEILGKGRLGPDV